MKNISLQSQKIKSFVLRQGRLTKGQQHAIDTLLPKYAIDYHHYHLSNTIIDFTKYFDNNNPIIVEIGFGMADTSISIAQNNPQYNYIGIEVHSPGIGTLLMQLAKHDIKNLKIIWYDAVATLEHIIGNNNIHGFHIFFPDPWTKRRHHKRRLINEAFVQLLIAKLTINGYISIATDDDDYAAAIKEILINNNHLRIENNTLDLACNINKPLTKFEKRGLQLNHQIYNFYAIKL